MHFRCDVNIDPFVYMQENNKTYGLFSYVFPLGTPTQLHSNSGFTITLYEYGRTIESLWSTVHGILHPPVLSTHHADLLTHLPTHSLLPSFEDFMAEHPEYVAQNNAMNYLSDNGGADYNLCHCTFLSTN